MATPQKKYPYAIYYNDGSYMIYDITKEDFDILCKKLTEKPAFNTGGLQYGQAAAVELSIGVISMRDIRSVIKQNPPKPVKKNEGTAPDLTPEEIEWMVANKSAWREGDDLQ